MTEWNIKPMCFVTSDLEGSCHLNLPVIVYSELMPSFLCWCDMHRHFILVLSFTEPPDSVSISVVNHTGWMFEHHQYTLKCTVRDVAPVENLIVTFYRGWTALARLQSKKTEKTPVSETFTLSIRPSKDDDGAQYWCEAKLQLEAEGPLVVTSQKLTATVCCE